VRVVAVLGYSGRGTDGLDPVCASRLRHAEGLAADAVVLSGRARGTAGEAELMRAAWHGPDVPIVSETTARSTAENAVTMSFKSTVLRSTAELPCPPPLYP
jgi:predicted TIM-barrel enzyme